MTFGTINKLAKSTANNIKSVAHQWLIHIKSNKLQDCLHKQVTSVTQDERQTGESCHKILNIIQPQLPVYTIGVRTSK